MELASGSTRIVVIGEGLIELCGSPFGALHQGLGGDTLNTALYLARLLPPTVSVAYASAVGQDSLSDTLLQQWHAEGLDTALTLRDAKRLPGLYQVQVDASGERRFLYWRQESAARYFLRHQDFARVRRALAAAHLIYLSGISLAILPEEDRTQLIALLSSLAAQGAKIAFDTNYRESLWSSTEAAKAAISAILPTAHLVFATFDDEQRLWSDHSPDHTHRRHHAENLSPIVVKLGASGCLYAGPAGAKHVPAARISGVVDTTAAGDSFNAAFLAAWLSGANPEDCCRAGNALAAIVIQHHGAIIPKSATPTLRQLLETQLPEQPFCAAHSPGPRIL